MTITNTISAKLFGAVVAFAMVFTLVAPASAQSSADLQQLIDDLLAQVASLQGQLGQSTGGGSSMSHSGVCPYTWTRSLSQGDSGMDVMKLQQFLNSDAETRVAATGVGSAGQESEFFGGLTGAAVAKFQSKYRSDILTPLGLVSATPFFGPSTMAHANKLCVMTHGGGHTDGGTTDGGTTDGGTTDGGTTDGGSTDSSDGGALQGGESSLEDFDAKSGDDTDLEEGQKNAPVMDVEFDVEDGDIRIQRLDVAVTPASGNDESDPWDVFTSISLWVDGDKVAEIDADDEDEWEENEPANGDFRLRFTGLDIVFREDSQAEITVGASVAGSVDGTNDGEDWNFFVPTNGVRGEDSEDIDQFTGDTSDTVAIDINEEGQDDELKVRDSSNDPSATTLELDDNTKSDWMNVYTFQLDTDDSINDIEIEVLPVGFVFTSSTFTGLVDDVELRANGETYDDYSVNGDEVIFNLDNNEWVIEAGDKEDVEVWVKFNALASGDEGTTVYGTTTASDISAEGADDLSGSQLSGSAQGETHTLRTEGVSLNLKSSVEDEVQDANNTSANYGDYTLTVEVSAVGDTIYIPETVARGASTTVGIAYTVEDSNGATIGTGTTTESFTRTSGGSEAGGFVQINDGETVTFELNVTFDPAASGQFRIQVGTLGFNLSQAIPNDTQTANPDYNFESGNQFINN